MRYPSILILCLMIGTACSPPAEQQAVENPRTSLEQNLKPRKVQLIRPEVRERQPAIEVVGEIRPFDEVEISSEVAGRVLNIAVEVGDRVDKGALLCDLDPTTFELGLEQAKGALAAAQANLQLATKELERKKDLVSDNTIPQSTFDQVLAQHDLAAAQVQEAQAALGLAEHRLRMTKIRAPAAGAISGRLVASGQWVDVGQTLLEMATGNQVKVVGRLPSSWAEELQGLKIFQFTLGTESKVRQAKLFSIDPVINENSRSFDLVGTAPADGLKAGAFARIQLHSLETERTLWLPVSAVVISDTPRVLMVEDSKITIRRIQTGLRSDHMVEIVSGLSENEEVVSSVAGLSRGLPVEVVS